MKGMTLASMHNQTRLDLCFLDADSAMVHASSTGGGWRGTTPEDAWDHLGGAFTTAPVMVATKARPPVLNTTPNVLPSPRGGRAATDRPAAAATLTGSILGGGTVFDPQPRLDVFGLGTDYAIYHQILWQGAMAAPPEWNSLGGSFVSGPTAVTAFAEERIDLFGLGVDRAMYHRPGTTKYGRPTGSGSAAPSVAMQARCPGRPADWTCLCAEPISRCDTGLTTAPTGLTTGRT
jgi:hypothetical protein